MKYLAMFSLLLALPALAAPVTISLNGLLTMVVYVVIVGLIFYCIWWFIGYVAPPEPFNKVIRVIVGLVALVVIIGLLFSLLGHPVAVFR